MVMGRPISLVDDVEVSLDEPFSQDGCMPNFSARRWKTREHEEGRGNTVLGSEGVVSATPEFLSLAHFLVYLVVYFLVYFLVYLVVYLVVFPYLESLKTYN